MKRKAHDHRALLLFAGALVAIAGIAWGAGNRSHAKAVASTSPLVVATLPSSTPAVAAPAPAVAATPTVVASQPTSLSSVTATPVVAEAGMRIYIDPETGERGMPGPEHVMTGDANANQDMSDLQQVRLPDGSVMIDLQGRFQETMIMEIDANGQRVVRCVTDPKAADFKAPDVKTPAQPSGREEK